MAVAAAVAVALRVHALARHVVAADAAHRAAGDGTRVGALPDVLRAASGGGKACDEF